MTQKSPRRLLNACFHHFVTWGANPGRDVERFGKRRPPRDTIRGAKCEQMRGATTKKKQIPHPVQKKNVVRNDTCWSFENNPRGRGEPRPYKVDQRCGSVVDVGFGFELG